ncbi:MAG: Transcriptional regulator, LuxR family, partial [Candidatus Nomurabacteria bacterium GW2011_GWC2_36_9]
QFPRCYKRLKEVYGQSREFRYLAARRFIKCNCGEFDNVLDVDDNGLIHPELVTCPMRGECLDEGIICLPERETGLTAREKEIAQYHFFRPGQIGYHNVINFCQKRNRLVWICQKFTG